ncbi:J domain-containing protein [Microbulbifer guangxiensis]|uniref:J domain-containing protein n=1 Tax=Microbulbifer guangxiensis TaxID=2904249 RepID=UPI001F2500E6|nr:DnaJ domain-containing protein [Microbulbifer guangxiensis]
MNCWSVLGIPEGSDRALIRKAYAKLIKQYRPDEYPKEFQQYNEAYELAMASLRDPQTSAEFGAEPAEVALNGKACNGQGHYVESLAEEFFSGGAISDESREDDELQNILCHLHRILSGPDPANVMHWDFLVNCDRLLDTDFRYRLTGEIFSAIGQYNHALELDPSRKIGEDVMWCLDRYLNFIGSEHGDYPQVTLVEWCALELPSEGSNPSAQAESLHGVRGGKIRAPAEDDALPVWARIVKAVLFGVIASTVILGVVMMAVNGGGIFIYVFMLVAIVQFLTVLLKKY